MFPLQFLLLLLSNVTFVLSLNILMFVPTLSYSHLAFNGKIADILIEKGHKVVMLVVSVDDTVPSHGITKAELIRRDVSIPAGVFHSSLWNNPGPFEDSSPLNPKILLKFLRVTGLFVDACEALSTDFSLFSHLSSFHFDVATIEQYDLCGLGLFSKLEIPSHIWLSATGLYSMQVETMGISQPKSYVPELFSPFSDEMNFRERIENILIAKVTSMVFSFFSIVKQSLIWKKQKAIHMDESLEKLASDSSFLLSNTHFSLDFPSPTSSFVWNIGGFTVNKKPLTLDTNWERIADSSPFILVSFGSIARTCDMDEKMKGMLLRTFDHFPNTTFIVKYEDMEETIRFYNEHIVLTKWIPQISLMAHSNYIGIITHGGWSSILESITYAKPLLLMPLFADHGKNARVVESLGIGLLIDKMTVTEGELIEKVDNLLHNKRLHSRCLQHSLLLDSSPVDHSTIIDFVFQRAFRKTRISLREKQLSHDSFTNSKEYPNTTVYLNRVHKNYLHDHYGTPKHDSKGLLSTYYVDLSFILFFTVLILK